LIENYEAIRLTELGYILGFPARRIRILPGDYIYQGRIVLNQTNNRDKIQLFLPEIGFEKTGIYGKILFVGGKESARQHYRRHCQYYRTAHNKQRNQTKNKPETNGQFFCHKSLSI
jgi:hypothetical protein